MAFTPSYDIDLFISYARDDDAPPIVDDRGWVSEFVKRLEASLVGRIGRDARNLRVFFDRRDVTGSDELERLKAAARGSAAFLAIGSPSYLDSTWCRDELAAYLVADPKCERLFAIEMLPLPEGPQVPERLRSRHRSPFWEVRKPHSSTPQPLHPNQERYFSHQQDLAGQIAAVLTSLRATLLEGAGVRAASGTDIAARRDRGAVFLGQTTDDLDDERDSVRSYLEQAGYRVLPEGDLPGGGPEFRKAVAAGLSDPGVRLHVQLLGQRPGRKPADLAEGYLRAQHDAAREAGVEQLIWRHPDIDLKAVHDPDYLSLLNEEAVIASTLESFKEAVVKRLARPPRRDPAPRRLDQEILFINSDQNDLAAAIRIQDELGARRKTSIVAELAGMAGDKREILESGLTDNNIILLVFGSAKITWVLKQLSLFRKLNPPSDEKIVVVLLGPPGSKPENLGIRMPELRYVDCRNGWKVDQILEIIDEAAA